jgi:hypothetical protein
MRRLVEKAESDEACKSKSDRDSSAVYLHPFDHQNMTGAERGLVLWSGFLYGQLMSARSSDCSESHDAIQKLWALMEVHKVSLQYDHSDAEDASIDAIRDLFYHTHGLDWSNAALSVLHDSKIALEVLTDFMVYGEQGDRYAKLVDASLVPVISKRNISFAVLQKRKAAVHEDLLRVSNEIIKKFLQKGKDERAGIPAPDLMARCRYHAHAGKGQPCYLDK